VYALSRFLELGDGDGGAGAGGWRLWRLLPRTFPYVKPYWKLAVASIVSIAIAVAIGLAEPWPLALLVDSVLGSHPSPRFLRPLIHAHDRYGLLVFVVVAGLAIHVLGSVLAVVTEYVNTKLSQKMTLDFRSDLFQHAQRLSLAFHDEHATGEFMGRINYAADSAGSILVAIPPLVQSLLTLVGMFWIAYSLDPQLALLSLAVVPFLYYTIGLYGSRIVPRLRQVQGLEWQSLSIVLEAMTMLRVIVAFGREHHEFRRFRRQGETAVASRVQLTVRQTVFSLAVKALTAGGTALVLGFGAIHVLHRDLTVGELLVVMSYIAAVYAPLEQISSAMGSLQEQFVQLQMSLELLDTPVEIEDRAGALALHRAEGRLEFDDVSFAYKGRERTLDRITFTVEAGQRVGIVGPTGAGKTTLMALVTRFFDPTSGRVLLDGDDVRDLTLESLRNQISVVLQEPLLFSGSILENIRYGRLDASDDEVYDAARKANAHDFIAGLPNGYSTELGERGAQLSGGERQRIAVARAFLKDAPVLILDEPTSQIDSRTEAVILDALELLMEGRTTFMIAHRLSTLRQADLIVVLDHGRLVEHGTHSDLMARDGLYTQLWEMQVGRRHRRLRALERSSDGLRAHVDGSDGDDSGEAATGARWLALAIAAAVRERSFERLAALARNTSSSDGELRAAAEVADALLRDSETLEELVLDRERVDEPTPHAAAAGRARLRGVAFGGSRRFGGGRPQ
jgi:ATP-binding cassette, subfamily B, bacterial